MVSLVLLLLVTVTSAGAYLLGTRRLRLRPRGLRGTLGAALECVGLVVLFLVANATIGVVVILVGRALTGRYVTVYVVRDQSLALLSALQALVFWLWWRGPR